MRKLIRTVAVGAMVVGGLTLGASSAHAQDFVLPNVGGIYFEDTTGPMFPLVADASTQGFGGQICDLVARPAADNNDSVNPGNNLIVTSGGNSVTLVDVEGSVNKVTTASGLLLGDTVSVILDYGPRDEGRGPRFSAFFDIEFECQPEETTTTSTSTTTTTTIADTTTTTVAPTTTTPTTVPTTTTTPGATTTTVPVSIDVAAFTPVCIADTPFIDYNITVVGTTADTADITFVDLDGNVVEEIEDAPLSGQVIYPGASVSPPDWPGWMLNSAGFWVIDPTDARLRDGLTITVEVNPTASAAVSYPPATEACNSPTNAVTTTTTIANQLPKTGGDSARQLYVGLVLVLLGGLFVFTSRRQAT